MDFDSFLLSRASGKISNLAPAEADGVMFAANDKKTENKSEKEKTTKTHAQASQSGKPSRANMQLKQLCVGLLVGVLKERELSLARQALYPRLINALLVRQAGLCVEKEAKLSSERRKISPKQKRLIISLASIAAVALICFAVYADLNRYKKPLENTLISICESYGMKVSSCDLIKVPDSEHLYYPTIYCEINPYALARSDPDKMRELYQAFCDNEIIYDAEFIYDERYKYGSRFEICGKYGFDVDDVLFVSPSVSASFADLLRYADKVEPPASEARSSLFTQVNLSPAEQARV